MKQGILTLVMVASLALAGCNTLQGAGNKQLIGTGSGALIGGILGSKVGGGDGKLWATGAGALLGALAGSEIGASLDNADRAYANQANLNAQTAPIGKTIKWNNPETGNYGTITPTRDGYGANGEYCREYNQKVTVGGQQQSAYGTACRQPDGSWKIVS